MPAQEFSGVAVTSVGFETAWVCDAGAVFSPLPNTFDCVVWTPAVGTSLDCAGLRFDPGDRCFLGPVGEVTRPGAFANPASSAGGSGVGGSVTLQPFEYTPEQQGEVYGAMAVVFGLFLAAMAAVWGYKQILKVLSVGAPGGD